MWPKSLTSRQVSACVSLNILTDQLMYLVSFLVAICSGWLLNSLHDVATRKVLSLVMGCSI